MQIAIDFGYANQGLTPVFVAFKKLDWPAFTAVAPHPTISEVPGTGVYVFDFTPEPDVEYVFVVDGGGALDAAVRYLTGSVGVNTNSDSPDKVVNVIVKGGGGGVWTL